MSPEFVNNIATFAGISVAVVGAFLFAFWVAMGIWTFNDIRSRTHDWLAIVLAVLLVMVFPIVGLILYLLIRPKSSLAEVYDRALEEEALLRELEETPACSTCGVPVKDNWIFCPNCHSQLQHACPNCSNLVRNDWMICVYCGSQQRSAAPRLAPEAVQPQISPTSVYAGQPQISSQSATAATVSATASPSATVRPARNPFVRPTTTTQTPQDPDDSVYRAPRPSEG
jgi:RNA polymerase subunit RPABC4/transcription elongation factor Spt4